MDERGAGEGLRTVVAIRDGERVHWVAGGSAAIGGMNPTPGPRFFDVFRHPHSF